MRFVCADHGELINEKIEVNGYSLGPNTRRGEPNELDLEDVPFYVWTDEDGDLHIETEPRAERYLSKFGDWQTTLTRAVKRADCTTFTCPRPNCHNPVWLLEDDEPIPTR